MRDGASETSLKAMRGQSDPPACAAAVDVGGGRSAGTLGGASSAGDAVVAGEMYPGGGGRGPMMGRCQGA